jgi:energy-coupling factor transport system substrate-specific component
MKAVFRMWKNTRMIILVAVCAAIYAAALIAFKTAIPLVPGFTEVRVANIFPMVFGLLFGPAGAWGTAIGNLIGDLFGGTFGPGSIPGFCGNFLLGYLPFAMWTTLLPIANNSREWKPGNLFCWINYILIAFISSAACGVVIGAGVDALGSVPYTVLSKIITVNNTIASVIGVALLTSVFGVVRYQFGLFWAEIMEETEMGRPIAGTFGAWVVAIASFIGILGDMLIDLPSATIGWGATLAIIIGSLLL